MIRTARVIALTGTRTAMVEVTRETACGDTCGSCTGCAAKDELIQAAAVNRVGAAPGDRVFIESGTRETLKLAAIVYLMPIALFLIGWLFHPLAGALCALAGIGAVFTVNRRLQRRGGVTIHITGYAGPDD